MKIKIIPVFLLCLVCVGHSKAQQIFSMSQFMQHNFIYNPAAAGASDQASLGITYKKMWTGIEGGPRTTMLYADKYFEALNTGGGLILYNDVTGPITRSGVEGCVSYGIYTSDYNQLKFGLSGQLLQERIDKAAVQKYIPDDPLLATAGSSTTGDAAFGVYYTTPKLNIGVSAKQLIQSKLNFIKTTTLNESRLYRHYYVMGSYNYQLDSQNILIPNFIIKMAAHSPFDFEAGARLEHKKLLWFGINYHYQQYYSAFLGFNINKKVSLGYAYDQYRTPLSIFDEGGGSHELSLKYYFEPR